MSEKKYINRGAKVKDLHIRMHHFVSLSKWRLILTQCRYQYIYIYFSLILQSNIYMSCYELKQWRKQIFQRRKKLLIKFLTVFLSEKSLKNRDY